MVAAVPPNCECPAGMLARKQKMLVAVALTNRPARRDWALATRKEDYRVRTAASAATERERIESKEAAGLGGQQNARNGQTVDKVGSENQ